MMILYMCVSNYYLEHICMIEEFVSFSRDGSLSNNLKNATKSTRDFSHQSSSSSLIV